MSDVWEFVVAIALILFLGWIMQGPSLDDRLRAIDDWERRMTDNAR